MFIDLARRGLLIAYRAKALHNSNLLCFLKMKNLSLFQSMEDNVLCLHHGVDIAVQL